jgi:hypothetical protein
MCRILIVIHSRDANSMGFSIFSACSGEKIAPVAGTKAKQGMEKLLLIYQRQMSFDVLHMLAEK